LVQKQKVDYLSFHKFAHENYKVPLLHFSSFSLQFLPN
jgi:hypothetical protein